MHASSANLLPKGAILLTTRASIGDSAILLRDATTNQGFQSIIVNSSFSNEFVYYLLKQNVGIMLRLASGSTFLEISKKKLSSINIVVPQSLIEQETIAEALSDVDALIAALDKKIAKKRLIKQGAMQQLLTGENRLAGFDKTWKIASMEDWVDARVISLYRGKVISKKDIEANPGSYPIYSSSVMNNGYMGSYGAYAFDCELISWSIDGGGNFFYRSKHKFSLTNVCGYMFLDESMFDYRYLTYQLSFLQSKENFDYLSKAHPSVISKIYRIARPEMAEQRSIALVLSDMDKEIADLEARRDKYKLIKNGMMQKLLTGQIRLTKPQAKVIPLATQIPATREIPVDAHIIAGHIVYRSYQSRGWGRTKLQKSLHLIGYSLQLKLGNEYIRNTAGPDDQLFMNYIDQKFKQYHHVNIVKKKLPDGRTHYTYIPTAQIQEVEMAYERYPQDVREQIDALLDKLNKMDLAGAEILSTLYAVWNNRIIKGEPITDNLLISDFYAWSAHKADFEEIRVKKALDYMRKQNIIPIGWGKYIDKK